jgi:hypothetical protein
MTTARIIELCAVMTDLERQLWADHLSELFGYRLAELDTGPQHYDWRAGQAEYRAALSKPDPPGGLFEPVEPMALVRDMSTPEASAERVSADVATRPASRIAAASVGISRRS